MQMLKIVNLDSPPGSPARAQVVFESDFQQYAILDNVRAMVQGLFPGTSLQVEQVDDLTFEVTRG